MAEEISADDVIDARHRAQAALYRKIAGLVLSADDADDINRLAGAFAVVTWGVEGGDFNHTSEDLSLPDE